MSRKSACRAPSANRLLPGDVHVWWYELDVCRQREATLERTLDDQERLRADRFRFAKHRRRFVVARGTLREIIARYTGMDPGAVRFERGAHGKPSLGASGITGSLAFNASDSHDLAAVALARGAELGIDVERVSPGRDCDLIASREFSAEEKAWLRELPGNDRAMGFFELWTFKEAYLKGKGLGLTVPLDCFAVALGPKQAPRLAWSAIDADDPRRWSLHRLAAAPGFVASLAVKGGARDLQQARWCA